LVKEAAAGKIVGIEDLGVTEDVLFVDDTEQADSTYGQLEKASFYQNLAEMIKSLPEREALILSLYYDDELNLREIGSVLNVSESRVSQIHSQAMMRLKARMKDWQ
jgi:RNA polymerase sigma factor for flagellar operon FliA